MNYYTVTGIVCVDSDRSFLVAINAAKQKFNAYSYAAMRPYKPGVGGKEFVMMH
jgi:hypothetical protein